MKILILGNYFYGDFWQQYRYLQDNIDRNRYNYYSPADMIKKNNTTKVEDSIFFLQLISIIPHVKDVFDTLRHLNNKHTIYFGPAIKDITFDKIYVVEKNIISTQESFFHTLLKDMEYQDVYLSHNAHESFNSIEELVDYLNV
jgi:hypothetical protein